MRRHLTPGEVSGYWTGRAMAYIRSQPGDWLKLMARKTAVAFNATEASDTESQDVYADWSWLLKAPFDFAIVLAAAVFGLCAMGLEPLRRLWWLWAIGVTYAASVIAFYVFARYRFPIVPVL